VYSTTTGPGPRLVRAWRAGGVSDLRLAALETLANHLRHDDQVRGVELRASLVQRVEEGSTPLVLPSGADQEGRKLTETVVRIRKHRIRDWLSEEAALLHEEALAAIGSGSPARYEDVVGAYVRALTVFPIVWAQYGVRFDADRRWCSSGVLQYGARLDARALLS
jgi:hypothetical protein